MWQDASILNKEQAQAHDVELIIAGKEGDRL